MQRRKTTYKLYPNAKQTLLLGELLRQHKDLWNAALEERIDAWRKFRKSISYEDQCASLTKIRQELPDDWAQANCSAQQITLRRLDKAFKAFFARCAKGQTPGFPRFKSIARMPGIGFKGHGDGLRFAPNEANPGPDGRGRPDDFGVTRWMKHGTLRLQGVGHIKVRGEARAGATIKSCELLHRYGQWHVSVTVECADEDVARTRTASHAMAADWGVSKLLTLVRTDGPHAEVVEIIDNPRWFKTNQERLVALDRAVSSKKRGSRNWRKASALRAGFKARVARKRLDFQHKESARIASQCAFFATEKLSIKNMMASAAATAEEPGKNVAQKSGLNREIGDTGGAALFMKIAYKVQETGMRLHEQPRGKYFEAPTRRLKPSQRCPACDAVVKKALCERVHRCGACGYTEDRDIASARIVLRWLIGTLSDDEVENVLEVPGRNCPGGQSHETASNLHARIGGR